MEHYREIKDQPHLDDLFASTSHFHDSLTKEIRIINRGAVRFDHSMEMGHQFDAQVLIQSQIPPFGLELLFIQVLELSLAHPGENSGGKGIIRPELNLSDTKSILFDLDGRLRVISKRYFIENAQNGWEKNRFYCQKCRLQMQYQHYAWTVSGGYVAHVIALGRRTRTRNIPSVQNVKT